MRSTDPERSTDLEKALDALDLALFGVTNDYPALAGRLTDDKDIDRFVSALAEFWTWRTQKNKQALIDAVASFVPRAEKEEK